MSTLTQFFGGQSAIKSIQRGISSGSASRTVTISAVDPSKSIVISDCVDGRSSNDQSGYYNITAVATLSNATTLQITEGTRLSSGVGLVNTATTCAWQVIEFN